MNSGYLGYTCVQNKCEVSVILQAGKHEHSYKVTDN